jgi:CheY-like chemotaxis protein
MYGDSRHSGEGRVKPGMTRLERGDTLGNATPTRFGARKESFDANNLANHGLGSVDKSASGLVPVGGVKVLNILIVEDDPLLAETVKSLVELNPRFRVTALATDLSSAMEAVETQRPDLALVDLQLANGSSGYAVAGRLHDSGIACLFTTARAPGFAVRDLAIGCLQKPYREEDLVRALSEAEDILKGRKKLVLRRRLPEPLEIYGEEDETAEAPFVLQAGGRTSWLAKLKKLVRRPSSFRSAAA